MLKDKPAHIDISKQLWIEMMQNIRDGILRKLKAAKSMLAIDKDIAAGVYVYAVEELGKLLLLKKATELNGLRRVKYRSEFVCHDQKFKAAFDYFQANDYDACLVISETWFEANVISWDIIEKRLLAETQSRLLIFYSDFTYNDKMQKIVIERPPIVALDILRKAIDGLEIATNNLITS